MSFRVSLVYVGFCIATVACGSDSGGTADGTGASPGTGGGASGGAPGSTRLVKSELSRAPATAEEAVGAAADTRAFGWDFYRQIADTSENHVYSPYSISVAATMLSAGADGNTLAEMETALHMSTPIDERHQSHNALAQQLAARNHAATEGSNAQVLRSSNDFWMAPALEPSAPFMDTLATSYGSGVHLADFEKEPEPSRQAINSKVSDDTEGLIPELLPQGSIDSSVVFVLTNALYFKSRWMHEFRQDDTSPSPFTTISGVVADVDMMRQTNHFAYFAGDGYQAASLPYFGNELELVVILPDAGTFVDFIAGLDDTVMRSIVATATRTKLELWMPKLEIDAEVRLKAELQDAGMIDAFEPGVADFSPIAPDVYITDAFHQAAIIIDEEGTEAAAATAFVGGVTSAPPPEEPVPFHLDSPFIFVLRDLPTNTTLFIGHYVSP